MQQEELRVISLTLACVIAVGAIAQSSGFKAVDAQYAITGALVVDPPPNQERDRVAIFLSGEGAREIYEAMPSRVENADACEEGMTVKRSGGLECTSISGKNFSCSVGILLRSGATKPIGAC